jgi:translation initiation factor eIF-2B subunit alpha/methylthioribose-1-phosphate isomerase
MIVRGAPAIGASAAFAVAQAAAEFRGKDMRKFGLHMKDACDLIRKARPTAYDLFHAVDFLSGRIPSSDSVAEAKKIAVKESMAYADRSAEACRKIGEFGEKLIRDGFSVLTHCNAGALACVDYGTALSPIRFAHYDKKKIHVFVDETRPRLQGAKLTSWELIQEGIGHSIIVDNAAGYFMQKGEVDMCIVGADRITTKGDVINKIGTYEKAVLAKENGIPFYVAAPRSTFDSATRNGAEVAIEERSEDEVLCVGGVRVAPIDAHARNPGFDVTPKRYVSGFITERGVEK